MNHRPGATLSAGSQTVLPTVRFSSATTVVFTTAANRSPCRSRSTCPTGRLAGGRHGIVSPEVDDALPEQRLCGRAKDRLVLPVPDQVEAIRAARAPTSQTDPVCRRALEAREQQPGSGGRRGRAPACASRATVHPTKPAAGTTQRIRFSHMVARADLYRPSMLNA